MSYQNKNEKRIFINHQTELLIWLIIVLILVAISSLTFIHRNKNDENDYQIFLPDVDGLIVGSPVRMMGIEVGHIVKIKPVKDEVYIKFILTDHNVHIPQGSTVTVEFSGMAGSKSLEIYLPQKDNYIDKTTPIMSINPPKRLHDAVHLLDEMYKKIGTIIYSFSSLGSKLDKANLKFEEKPKTGTDFNGFLQYSGDFLDNSTSKANDIRNNIEGFTKNAKQIH